jgi:hypothetical protein
MVLTSVLRRVVWLIAGLAGSAGFAAAADGLRVVSWNITFYPGDRAEQIGTVVYGQWNGRSLDADVFCLQEMVSRNAVLAFVNALNSAPGSPGDWTAAPVFTNLHSSMGTALVYRTTKLELIAPTIVSLGGPPPKHPRNIVRYDMRPVGYPEDASVISFYPLHFKAGTGAANEERRLSEAVLLAADIRSLPEGRHVVVGADLNIRTAQEAAYRVFNGDSPNTGVLWDPISRVGSWNSNPVYRNIHTQDPRATNGGMDDRYDQVLVSASLLDERGMDYDGAFPTPWDLSTPEDPAHGYRAWGNDGSAYNGALRVAGNVMVGPLIAQAIVDMADPNGHIPVYVDLDMPGRLRVVAGVNGVLDLGQVRFGESPSFGVRVGNAGDTTLWGIGGVSSLAYGFERGVGVQGPVGPVGTFEAPAGQQLSDHVFEIDSSAFVTGGAQRVSVAVVSDDPTGVPSVVNVGFEVIGCSEADTAEPLGTLNFADVIGFLDAFSSEQENADLAEPSGVFNFVDVMAFLVVYLKGC